MWTTFWKYEGIQELMEKLVMTTFAEYQRFPKKDLNAEDLGKQFIRTFLHFHYGDSKLVGCFLKHDEFWKLPVGLIKTVNVYFAHTLNDVFYKNPYRKQKHSQTDKTKTKAKK